MIKQMKRLNAKLKHLANNTSRRMHKEVELHVINGDNNRSKLEQANMNFIIARQLIADLPLVPSNDLLYTVVDNMQNGLYNDLLPYENHWQECLKRTQDILIKQNRLIPYDTEIHKPIITNRQ